MKARREFAYVMDDYAEEEEVGYHAAGERLMGGMRLGQGTTGGLSRQGSSRRVRQARSTTPFPENR
jgi:hypothetical protein